MARAKPAYDVGGTGKVKQYKQEEWIAIEKSVTQELADLCPIEDASEEQVSEWARLMLSEAHESVSVMAWHMRRLTNEELRAEKEDLLRVLDATIERLGSVSHDFERMLPDRADLLGVKDSLVQTRCFVAESEYSIAELPRAKRERQIGQAASAEMAVRVLRVFKESGGEIAATAETSHGYVSDAIKVLQILGNALGVRLDPTTWRKRVSDARKSASDLRSG